MLISEKQLLVMFDSLRASLGMQNSDELELYAFNEEYRKNVYSEIIEQQPKDLVKISDLSFEQKPELKKKVAK